MTKHDKRSVYAGRDACRNNTLCNDVRHLWGNPLEDNFRKLHDYTLGIESIPPQTAIADSLFEFVFARLTRRRTCIHRPA